MKTKLLLILSCFIILIGCRCGSYPNNGYDAGYDSGYGSSYSCGSSNYSSNSGCSSCAKSSYTCGMSDAEKCACADPGCRGGNYCLSRCRCCKYFGNIGAIDYPGDYTCDDPCDS